jgi:V8-like Glu-specific endopeptidase
LGLALVAAALLLGASGASPAGCDGLPPQAVAPHPDGAGIVNGVPTNYETWQGVIALIWVDVGFICTGTLIDPEVVLSAGHCVYLPDAGIDFVTEPSGVWIAGGADLNAGFENMRYVEEVVAHPTWDGTGAGTDLSMLKLSVPLYEVESYPVRVAPQIGVGETVQIVGYGQTSADDLESAGIHRAGESTVLTVNAAEIEIGGAANGCYGDSGGPMFGWQDDAWAVSGVTSHGTTEECLAESGGWYVNVLAYRDWMDETMWALVGHGLGESDTDTDADTDTETDTDADAGTDGDADADGEADLDVDGDSDHNLDPGDGRDDSSGSCVCGAAGARPRSPFFGSLLQSLI